MQQYNNDIENKLRQLENQQLPDLSAMDAHWKEMQATLAPGIAIPRKRSLLRRYLLAAVSIAAVGLIIYFTLRDHPGNKVEGLASNNNKPTVTTNSFVTPVADTGVKKKPFTLPVWKIIREPNGIVPPIRLVRVDTAIAVKNFDSNATLATLSNNSALLLNNFYTSIQKPAQEFIINADKGAELICKEGSKISIPPAAFIDGNGNGVLGKITINVAEYYKYSDMITANLTTVSNGEQLITGGMIKLTALQNNREVQLRNDKALNLKMPTKNYDAEMQLFLADENNQSNKFLNTEAVLRTTIDTTAPGNLYSRNLNWQVANTSGRLWFDGKTKFLNMPDEPTWVRETSRKRIAKFYITKESSMTEAEAKKMLKEKYGDYYDVIKVKKISPYKKTVVTWKFDDYIVIGDSVRLTVDQAVKWHYIDRKDSLFYVQKVKEDSIKFIRAQPIAWNVVIPGLILEQSRDSFYSARFVDSLNNIFQQRLKVEQAYNFSINRMGWINCDKFYNYKDKTDFVLDLPADVQADKFVTQIVFTNIRSVMPGLYQQNKIGFLNIPKNMPVYVVGLGERNGKVVSFMQSLKTGANTVSINKFDETTPEAFKEKLKQLDL